MNEKQIYDLICEARKKCREMHCSKCDFRNRKDCKYELMAKHIAEKVNKTITYRYELDVKTW